MLNTKSNLFIGKSPQARLELSQLMAKNFNKRLVGLSHLKVLIIDDDSDDVMIMEEYLQEAFNGLDLEVQSANSYLEAIRLLRDESYDVCFVDYLLGAETGLDLLESIKTEKLVVPVVFVTGQGDENVAANAIKKGAREYLVKAELDSQLIKQTVMEIYGYASLEDSTPSRKVFLGSRIARRSFAGAYSSYTFFMFVDSFLQL